MEAPPVTVMPVTGGTINMMEYLLQGQPEVGDKSRHALVRNCVDVAASHSLPEFLNEMGFRMDHEFVANGHIFRKGAYENCSEQAVTHPGAGEHRQHRTSVTFIPGGAERVGSCRESSRADGCLYTLTYLRINADEDELAEVERTCCSRISNSEPEASHAASGMSGMGTE
ncbi:Mediator of RNA polymerase II transcription subunit 18 [Collichthys lucidus]|uniref:Mediator of RNA polymerase II transcription subunit 18 n=1 Tax=Collichthys lucidus TaxID=240159 RepID=A0A4U5V3M5_COLLU|nr:Mediator of RNA polymerase II transcription subunit 18 [Collichthys lucidus]